MEDKYSMQPGQEAEHKKPDAEDVDALLQDVKSLLGETDNGAAEQSSPAEEPEDAEGDSPDLSEL